MEQMISLTEFAQELGVTTRTIQNYLAEGKITGVKVAGKWRFPKEELYRLIGTSEEVAQNPATEFLKATDFSQASSMQVFNIPFKTPTEIESLRDHFLEQFNLVYSGEGRQFYYEILGSNQARVIIIGNQSYVASFGNWLYQELSKRLTKA